MKRKCMLAFTVIPKHSDDTDSCDTPLTHKYMEMHGCMLSAVVTDILVLKHQAISIHSPD